jgi:hypothetical protein
VRVVKTRFELGDKESFACEGEDLTGQRGQDLSQ